MNKTTSLQEKKQFIQKVANGQWFLTTTRYGHPYLVKLKGVIETLEIQALWLSYQDTEGITLNEYREDLWNFSENVLSFSGSSAYHVGSFDDEDEDSIYNEEDGTLNEDKLFSVILQFAPKDLLTEEELLSAWTDIKNNNMSQYETLAVSE